jgi:hypothetical protein
LVIEPSPILVNQNDTSKLDEGEDSKLNDNKSIHWLFSNTDKVDIDTEIVLQQEVVKDWDWETIEEKEVHVELEGEEETQYNP